MSETEGSYPPEKVTQATRNRVKEWRENNERLAVETDDDNRAVLVNRLAVLVNSLEFNPATPEGEATANAIMLPPVGTLKTWDRTLRKLEADLEGWTGKPSKESKRRFASMDATKLRAKFKDAGFDLSTADGKAKLDATLAPDPADVAAKDAKRDADKLAKVYRGFDPAKVRDARAKAEDLRHTANGFAPATVARVCELAVSLRDDGLRRPHVVHNGKTVAGTTRQAALFLLEASGHTPTAFGGGSIVPVELPADTGMLELIKIARDDNEGQRVVTVDAAYCSAALQSEAAKAAGLSIPQETFAKLVRVKGKPGNAKSLREVLVILKNAPAAFELLRADMLTRKLAEDLARWDQTKAAAELDKFKATVGDGADAKALKDATAALRKAVPNPDDKDKPDDKTAAFAQLEKALDKVQRYKPAPAVVTRLETLLATWRAKDAPEPKRRTRAAPVQPEAVPYVEPIKKAAG